MLRLGVDIGGTFTDFVLADDVRGSAWFGKTLTTPHDPGDAIVSGLQQICADASVSPADIA
jgi:N-methylhydantoinase A